MPIKEPELDFSDAIDNLLMNQKRVMLDFLGVMKTSDYKNQIEMEIAKEKVGELLDFIFLKIVFLKGHDFLKTCSIIGSILFNALLLKTLICFRIRFIQLKKLKHFKSFS